ncbi:MAG: hypothetical protein WC269_03300 [Candidatus Gracilibacteria bacterium]|jgi:hypothetical protein
MAQAPQPSSIKRVLKTSLVLISIGTFAVILMGFSVLQTSRENKKTMKFLEIAKDAQPNFETSLVLYTEKTQDVITHLLELRPENESKYIEFISEVEKIGQDLSLNIKIDSYQDTISKNKIDTSKQKTLNYQITFFGSITNLNQFLSKLEGLQYLIKVDTIDFTDLSLIEKDENTPPNVKIKIKLYTK